MFFGRVNELNKLRELRRKSSASVVCILGRRRIGKSALVEQFGKEFKSYLAIQGLGPEKVNSNQAQLDHFSQTVSLQLGIRQEHFKDWSEAFYHLAHHTKKGEVLILLDEISWMGRHDSHFAVKLKAAWDQYFKQNPKLILVLCGSVSSWLEDNILNNTSFEGRVSLRLNLEGLKLEEIKTFWESQHFHLGSLEQMLILSVAGGVPKYLEEITRSRSAEANVIKLCFEPSGILFNEYDLIFSNIFERRTKSLEKIVRICIEEKLQPSEIASKLGKAYDNHLAQLLHILEISGFVSRDFYFKFDGTVSKLSHIRIKDNYLRFYMKYIEPQKQAILKGGKVIKSLYDLKNFDGILGYQFENLILANRELVYPFLGIDLGSIISAAPHVQRQKGRSCQIDLLIHSKLDVFFVCEFKCKKIIDASIIGEIQRKMKALKLPNRSSAKPVLIYEGELRDIEELEAFFYRIISWTNLG